MESIVKFIVSTPLGFTVRTTESYWQTLLIKHPDITHYETEIQQTLNQPDAIYQSQRDIIRGRERSHLLPLPFRTVHETFTSHGS